MATYLVVAVVWLLFLATSIFSITSNQKCLKAEFDYGREFVWIQPLHNVYDDMPITSAAELAQGSYFTMDPQSWATGSTLTGFEQTDTETILFTNNAADSQLELILAHDAPCSPGGVEYCPGGSNHAHNTGCGNACDSDGVQLRLDIEVVGCCTGGDCNCPMAAPITINYAANDKNRHENNNITDYSSTCNQYMDTPDDSYLWNTIETRGTFTVGNIGSSFLSTNRGMVLGNFPTSSDWCMDMEYLSLLAYPTPSLIDAIGTPGIKYFSFVTETQQKSSPGTAQQWNYATFDRSLVGSRIKICNMNCSLLCSDYQDCGSCLSHSACGWCGSSGQCVLKSTDTPNAAADPSTCPSGFLTSACTDCDCQSKSNCSSCLATPGCGYCFESNQCLPGTSKAPSSCAGSCDYWFADSPSQCSNLPQWPGAINKPIEDVIFDYRFENNAKAGWIAIDPVDAENAPSQWLLSNHQIVQLGSIYTGAAPNLEGTWLYLNDMLVGYGSAAQISVQWSAIRKTLASGNPIGIAFRYLDFNNFYLMEYANTDPLVCDTEVGRPSYRTQRLKKKTNGVYSTLWEFDIGYDIYYPYVLSIQVYEAFNFNNAMDATQIILSTVRSDGTTVIQPDSNSFTSHLVITDSAANRPLWGTVALATANNSQAMFDNVIVKRLSTPLHIGYNGLFTGAKETLYTFNFNTSDFSIGANDYYWISVSLYVFPSNASTTFLQGFKNFTLTFNSSTTQLIMNGTSTPNATQLTTFLAGRPASDDYRVFINNSYLPSLTTVFSIILDVTQMEYFEATPGQATLVSLDDNGMWGGYTNISFSLSSLSFVLKFDPHPTSYVTITLSPFYPTALSSSAFTITFPPTWGPENYEINYPSPVPSTNYYLFFYQQSTNTTHYTSPLDLWISVSYPFPMLTAVTPSVGPTTDLILTLTGMDFTTNLQGYGTVTVGGRACPYSASNWQPTQILCNLPSGTGANHLILVDTGNAADPLPSVVFSYAAPAVQTVTTTLARTKGGDSLTLIGSNFGIDRSVANVTVDGRKCNITSIIETRIVCSLPPGKGVQVPVVVTVDSQTSQVVTMSYDGPSISSINPLHGPSGTVLTLFGNNFGNDTLASAVSDPTCIDPNNCKNITFVTIDKLPCTPVVEANPTYDRNVEVHCTVPTLVGQNHLLQIAVANQFGNPQVFSYDAPQINSVNPNHGPTSGTTVTVYGANFGGPSTCSLVNATVTDYIGRIVYGSNLACINDSHVTFTIGRGIGVNHTIQLRIAGQVSNGVLFAYDAPQITSFLPAAASTQGGLLTIFGSNFGATVDEPNLAILVNGLACVLNSQSLHNQTLIICQYPAGEGTNKAVKITLGGLSSTATQVFNYVTPTIASISPATAPISPSSWLTITGSDFGTPKSANASIGGIDCLINTAVSNHSRIVCLTPVGQGTNLLVKVTTGGQTATATQRFSYTGPSIYSFAPSHGPTDGTAYIELTGDGFGTSGIVKVGTISCTALVHTNDFLRYTVGAGEGFNLPVTVNVSGQIVNASSSWSFDNPIVYSLSASSASTTGNVPITIRGANLGTGVGVTQYYIQFGAATVSSPFLSHSSSEVSFNIPPGSGKVTSIVYTVRTANGNQTATYTNQTLFAYNAPVLSTLTGCIAAGCSGGETAVISGSNFGPAGGAATVTITSRSGGVYQCTTPQVTNHSSLNCILPSITERGRNLTVTVTINGQTTSKGMVDYQGPQINSNSLQFPCPGSTSTSILLSTMNGGDSICFSGTGFGATQSAVSVWIGPYVISGVTGWFKCDITSFGATAITCTTTEGGGSNLHLRVIVSGAITDGTDTINYPTPVIKPNTIRANVTSVGTGTFTSTNTQGQAVVFDVDHLPRSYEFWPLVTVTASNDNGVTNYLCQNIQIFSLQGSGSSTPAVFGSTFTYSGATANQRALRCVTSPAVGTGYKFLVTVNGQASARGADTFAYPTTNVPTVTSVTAPTPDCTTSGNSLVDCAPGTTITIIGTNFCDSSCSFNVLLGGVMVSEQSYLYVSATEYHFDLPTGSGTGLFVQVLRDAFLSQANTAATISYKGPTVSSIQAPACAVTGFNAVCPTGDSVAASILTINGDNFGTSGASVFVGGMYCANLVHVDETKLTCTLPLGRDGDYPITVLKLGGTLVTSSFTIYYQNCLSGTYRSADPSSSLNCIPCPVGTISDVDQTNPPTPSATSCDVCPTGTTNNVDHSECQSCTPGTYSVASSVEGQGPSCINCPAGRSSSGSTDYCDPCQPGSSTKNLNGASSCTSCDMGYYASSLGNVNCTRCTPGTITSTTGAPYCTACEAGKYESGGLCINCVSGQYSSIAGATACSICLSGSFAKGSLGAQSGNLQCTQCPAGQFSNTTMATDCYSCTAGYYSVQTLNGKDFIGATSCVACSRGQYSLVLATPPVECQFCDKGKYSNATGSATCTSCGAGYYNGDLGQSTCLSSRAGTFVSGSGAVSYTKCYAGSFNNMSASSNCDPCSPGSYQPLTGATSCEPCLAGKFTQNGGQFACALCSPGYFAETQGLSTCTLCAEGKYSSFGASNCSLSPQSYYNNNPGQNVPLLCDPGTVTNSSGAVACSTCQPGTFASILRTSCDLCPLGYYTTQNATVNCLQCAAGRYANVTGTNNCVLCPAGKFQTNTGSSTCLDCPPGKSTTPGLSACFNCPAGSYTSKPATSACVQCASGSIQPFSGQSTCNLCVPGTYVTESGQTSCRQCEAGSYAPYPGGAAQCPSCPSGTFSDSHDLTKCTPCAQGTYMPVGGQSSCQSCSPGKFADNPGYANCKDCPAGRRAPSEGMTLCLPCDIGKYTSNNGSSYCQACLAGTFMNTTGAAKCTECYPGFYQDDTSSTVCKACSLGYSALGSGLYNCAPCSAGTFANVTGLAECRDCPAGTYQNNQNATSCEPCEAGKRSSRIEGSVSCISCAEGFHASESGSPECEECLPGKIAPEKGAINCTACELGKYVTSMGQSVCTVCEGGRYGPNASLDKCLDCPINQASTKQLTACVCKSGYFSPVNVSDVLVQPTCTACLLGALCVGAGNNLNTIETAAGYWRPNTDSLSFYQCLVPSDCQGGLESVCGPYRVGPICALCAPGSRKVASGDCSPCDTKPAVNAVGTTFIIIAIAIAIWVTFFFVIRSDRRLEPAAIAEDRSKWHSDYNAVPTPIEGEGEGDGPGSPSAASPSRKQPGSPGQPGTSQSQLAADFPNEEKKDELKNADDTPPPPAEVTENPDPLTPGPPDAPPVEPGEAHRLVDPTTGTNAKVSRPNLLYKIKIILSFFQIAVGVVDVIPIQWPTAFRSFLSVFNIFNIDFLQWSSVDCIATVDYYLTFVITIITPPCLLIVIVGVYLIPVYLQQHQRSYEDRFLELRARHRNAWKLFLFSLFLMYPKVSATVLQMYVCREVEGQYYMVADFTLECYDTRWYRYLPVNIIAILVYPVGIPAMFFTLLLLNRKSFFDARTRIKLGLLYDAYAKDTWWFELVDMSHKLFLTSILAFMPTSAQSPTGMVAVTVYSWVILLRKPYYRKGDDRLHLCAQVELFLILLAGHIFYNIGIPDKLSDVSMSVFLIGVFIGFMILFVLQSANIVKKLIKLRKQQRKADFEKKQFEDEKDWMREQQEMAALNMYAISGNIMVEAEQRYQERAEELYDSTMQKPSDRRGRKIQSVAGVMPANQQNGGDQDDGVPIPEDDQKDGIVLDANADALAARIAGST